MSRVEIAGQFPFDYAIFAGRQPYAIDRNPTSVRTDRVPSWNKLCDAADAALAPLSRSKTLVWAVSCASIVLVVVVVIFSVILPMALPIPFFVPIAIIAVLVVAQLMLACRHRSVLMATAKEVGEACAQCSGDGVTYALKDEPMPRRGCNRSIFSLGERQYYVTVEVDDKRGLGEPGVALAPQGKATAALEDMLK